MTGSVLRLLITDRVKPFPRCALCGSFREKDVKGITGETKEEIKKKLDSLGKPSPCLRLMSYCKEEPRLR